MFRQVLRGIVLASAMLAVNSTDAHAALTVRAEVRAGGAEAVSIMRAVSAAVEVESATVFYDEFGNRWEILLNADPYGTQSFVALTVRSTSPSGGVIAQYHPNLLVKNGEEATIEIQPDLPGGGSDTRGTAVPLKVRVVVTPDADAVEPSAVARAFFALPGEQRYRFGWMRPGWSGLACQDGEIEIRGFATPQVPPVKGEVFGGVFTLEGRYRAGERVETICTALTPDGPVTFPVSVSFM